MTFSRPKIIPQEQSSKKLFFASFASLLVTILIFAFLWPSLPPEVPLFYSKPWGDGQLASSYLLGLPIVLATIILFANSVFAQAIDDYPLIKRMLAFGSVTVCILTAITVLRIILLVK